MGIVGSNYARIGLSRALLLQFIILSFLDAEKKESLTSQLTVHIYDKDAEHIDFVDLEADAGQLIAGQHVSGCDFMRAHIFGSSD